MSSFQTFLDKPVSSGVVLIEFGSSVSQLFFLNEEAGIWRYEYYIFVDRVYSFENGAFCYGCFEQGCSGTAGNDNPKIQIISVNVDGTPYTEVSNIVDLRATNQSFWWDGDVIHIHFNNFDPPFIFQNIVLGAQINIASKAGNYNGIFYDGRLKSLSPLSVRADPLFFGLIRFSGTTFAVANEDGEFDSLSTLDLYGQVVEIRYGEEGGDYLLDFEKRFVGLIEDFSISYEELKINVKERRKGWSKSLPETFFDTSTYPDISATNADKPVPVLYGECLGVEVVCTNEDEAGPADYDFKICETTYHAIKSIDEVRVNGTVKVPTASSLANATFTLALADYSPGDTVVADVKGYVDSIGDLMDNALDILADVIENYADFAFTGDTYDITEWGAARLDAPTIHFFTDSAIKVQTVIEQICSSLDGIYFIKTNGRATFRYYHDLNAIAATAGVNSFLNSPVVSYPSENYLTTAVVNYARNFETDLLMTVKDTSKESELLTLYGISNRYEITTLLNVAADANDLLGFLVQEYALIAAICELRLPTEFLDIELLDYFRVQLDRLNAAWLGSVDFQVIGISQDLLGNTVRLTLRDKGVTAPVEVYIQGNFYGDNVGGAYYGDVKYEKTETVLAGGG